MTIKNCVLRDTVSRNRVDVKKIGKLGCGTSLLIPIPDRYNTESLLAASLPGDRHAATLS